MFEQLDLFRNRIIPRTEQTLQLATADYRSERVDFFSLIHIYQELLAFPVQVARLEASLAGTLARLDLAVGCPTDLSTGPQQQDASVNLRLSKGHPVMHNAASLGRRAAR